MPWAMLLATEQDSTRWIDALSNANASTRAFLFYSLALIAIGLYSAINRAFLHADIMPKATPGAMRDEPPAVVNLLVNNLETSADAPIAVLLHLARRNYFSIEISEDEIETVSTNPKRIDGQLRSYELAVLHLVDSAITELASDGHIVVDELQAFCRAKTTTDPQWWDLFRASVAEHALELKLVSRRCSPTMVRILQGLALAIVGIGIATMGHSSEARPSDPASWAVGVLTTSALLTFLSLSRLDLNELRYTRSGTRATADWLGARSVMQHVGSFAELGPSTVNIWGDRMHYATTTGVARETSRRMALVDGDGTEVWYVMNERWHHAKASVPRMAGWGRSPWRLLRDSAGPFLLSGAASSSVLAILWFGKIKSTNGERVGLQGAIDRVLHFPQRLSFAALPQVLTLAVSGGLLWILRRHLRRAAPVYRALLDIFMTRREQGVIAYEQDGWIGIGNPHSRAMTLYRLPPTIVPERGHLVELTATRYFGQVRAVRSVQPPKPRRPVFS